MKKEYLPTKLVAAYDTETTNVCTSGIVNTAIAFPVTHQVGTLYVDDFKTVTPDNVKDLATVNIYRDVKGAYQEFIRIIEAAEFQGYTPVVAVHNLGFDHTNLAHFFAIFQDQGCEVEVCAKTSTKPITYKIMDNGTPILIFLDTMSLFLRSLETMGKECGMPKLVGSWDYNLIRTPETPLTEMEVAYAKQDIYTLFAYVGHFLRLTPEIEFEDLGLSVVTKTGVVRRKRLKHFSNLGGKGRKKVGARWISMNQQEMPNSDEELFTMHASTRGGFTFTAANSASVVYEAENGKHVYAFDAASQHPSQMVSHVYPEKFRKVSAKYLTDAFESIASTSLEHVVLHWDKPFNVAFNAFFKFKNLRLKAGSLYEANGISPLASARLRTFKEVGPVDNQSTENFKNLLEERGYKDYAVNESVAFGKIMAADECGLFLTELAAWEVVQAFDFDEVEAVAGFATSRFCRPTDMSILSVMYFYKAKNIFKIAKNAYDSRQDIPNPEDLKRVAPDYLYEAMMNGTAKDADVAAYYQSLKADLNALFGIEATNEAKPDTLLTTNGIKFATSNGLNDLPNNPKCQYQYGQRIVGWSRIAQHVVMNVTHKHAEAIICGDTDSVKLYTSEDKLDAILTNLKTFEENLSRAKMFVTNRVAKNFPEYFDELPGIGGYELEDVFDHFYCAWNKAYVHMHYDKKAGRDVFNFTLAGITTDRDYRSFDDEDFSNSYNALANYLYHDCGKSFAEVSELLLSYNITIHPSITKLNGRKLPEWGAIFEGDVTDYLGNTAHVVAPQAVALFPLPKMIGATECRNNRLNSEYALRNNPNVNTDDVILSWEPNEKPYMFNLTTGEAKYLG